MSGADGAFFVSLGWRKLKAMKIPFDSENEAPSSMSLKEHPLHQHGTTPYIRFMTFRWVHCFT